jgi:hypothetical protein
MSIRNLARTTARRIHRGLIGGWRAPVGEHPNFATVTAWGDSVHVEFDEPVTGTRYTADEARLLGQQLIEAAARIDGMPAQTGNLRLVRRQGH